MNQADQLIHYNTYIFAPNFNSFLLIIPTMDSKRQQQVAEIILRNFSYVLQQEGLYIYGKAPLVTVTSVKVATDLQLARIYLSIYNAEQKELVLTQIRENEHKLKQEMYRRLRKHLRRMPSFEFFIDDTLDEMYRVEELFQRLEANQPPKISESADPV